MAPPLFPTLALILLGVGGAPGLRFSQINADLLLDHLLYALLGLQVFQATRFGLWGNNGREHITTSSVDVFTPSGPRRLKAKGRPFGRPFAEEHDGLIVVVLRGILGLAEAMLTYNGCGSHVGDGCFGDPARNLHPDALDRAINQITKVNRTSTTQMDALKRYRSKGEQKVVAEHPHVHVYLGGQAVVGTANQGMGAGVRSKREFNLMNQTNGCVFSKARQCSACSKRTKCQCRAPALKGKNVCRFHGGRAGAPSGPADGRYRHGGYTQEAMAERAIIRELVRDAREMVEALG